MLFDFDVVQIFPSALSQEKHRTFIVEAATMDEAASQFAQLQEQEAAVGEPLGVIKSSGVVEFEEVPLKTGGRIRIVEV